MSEVTLDNFKDTCYVVTHGEIKKGDVLEGSHKWGTGDKFAHVTIGTPVFNLTQHRRVWRPKREPEPDPTPEKTPPGHCKVLTGEVKVGDAVYFPKDGTWSYAFTTAGTSIEQMESEGLVVYRVATEAGAPEPTTKAQERKATPVATGVLDYFPNALRDIARCSKVGNDQHNPGTPLHWDREKSTDDADALIRHFLERGTEDEDGVLHSTKVAWRALALLEKELEGKQQGNTQ